MRSLSFIVVLVIFFQLGCYLPSIYSVNKRNAKFKGKRVTVKGRVKYWFPAPSFSFYLVILENKGRKIAVYKQFPYLKVNQRIKVRGKFYPAGSLLPLKLNLVVDSSTFRFKRNNFQFFRHQDTVNFELVPRFKLPPDCQ